MFDKTKKLSLGVAALAGAAVGGAAIAAGSGATVLLFGPERRE